MPESIDRVKQYAFISKIKSLPFVEKVILYGSRARSDARSRSDIDIAIDCPAATRDQWHEILDIVDEADTLLEIDCVRLDEAKGTFKENILKDGVEL